MYLLPRSYWLGMQREVQLSFPRASTRRDKGRTRRLVESFPLDLQDTNILDYKIPELRDEDVLIINQLDRKQRISNGADENGQVYGWSYEQLGWE